MGGANRKGFNGGFGDIDMDISKHWYELISISISILKCIPIGLFTDMEIDISSYQSVLISILISLNPPLNPFLLAPPILGTYSLRKLSLIYMEWTIIWHWYEPISISISILKCSPYRDILWYGDWYGFISMLNYGPFHVYQW